MSSSAAVTWVSDGTAGLPPQWAVNHDHQHAIGDSTWMEMLRRQQREDQDRVWAELLEQHRRQAELLEQHRRQMAESARRPVVVDPPAPPAAKPAPAEKVRRIRA